MSNENVSENLKTRTRYVLVGADFSQQEPRLLSQMSGDEQLINAYINKKDLYATMASQIHGNDYWDNMEHYEDGTPNPEGKKRRSAVKKLTLAILYGMGADSLAKDLKITQQEAQSLIDKFYTGFPKVKKWIESNKDFAHKYGYVEDIVGRRRRLPSAQLPKYSIDLIGDKILNEIFNPILGTEAISSHRGNTTISKYRKLLENAKNWQDVNKIKQEAIKDGVEIKNNSSYIAEAERQCTNARVQGCLSGRTEIEVFGLGKVKIKDVVGQHIKVWDGVGWSDADVVSSGRKPLVIIGFSNEVEVRCSTDHLFATSI